ncbi:YktB family protein [Alicyclobacillus hesperidum]|uniref:YktB family protein n=1 Tax=Alicyclobacillus hesperidum TaxID=89784 RepID=UPI00094401A6|nr:DUF1054 domain-containing protein [Alicyclobacillus hesperidum]
MPRLFNGFDEADFDVFFIPGLEPRMTAIRARIQPKLAVLGDYFVPFLSERLQSSMYAHVAKHARRTVNPPSDTWVAFSANSRGYKQHPHFQIGIWPTHVFAAFGYIYEAKDKVAFGHYLQAQASEIQRIVPDDFIYIPDHTQPSSIPAAQVADREIAAFGERLVQVKKAELLIGRRLDKELAITHSGAQLVEWVESTFTPLCKLWIEASRAQVSHG